MQAALLKRLVCPVDGAPLRLQAAEASGDEIRTGRLATPGRRYPIVDGVPCFLGPRQRAASRQGFNDMWRFRRQGRFEKRDIYGMRPEARADWLAGRFGAPFAAGSWVLDAGCGSADLTRALAARYPDTQFVGLEFTDEVRAVARSAPALPNLHFVQADLMAPPFEPGSFARVFSLGVLHHTPDTRAAFSRVATLVAPDGELLTWIYPDARESLLLAQLYFIRDVSFLGRGHRLPPELRFRLSQLYALGLMPSAVAAYQGYRLLSPLLGAGYERALDRDLSLSDLYDTMTFCLYDNITPEHQFRHGKREVLAWFRSLGFAGLRTDGQGTYRGRLRGRGGRASTAGGSFSAR